MLNAWGRKRWPEYPRAVFRVEVVDLGPGCDTCGYGGGVELHVTADHRKIAELCADFSALLNEMLEASA